MPRSPVIFVSHGAPTFAIEPGLLGPQLTEAGRTLPKPQAILIVSPHWMTSGIRVGTSAAPETIHDFGGFPEALYRITYPTPGAPTIAERAIKLLVDSGWPAVADTTRGLDHGAWVPLRYLYPDADVPVFQVSMPKDMDEATAYAMGKALAPLRDEGVMIVASGSLTHNLYEFRGPVNEDAEYAKVFSKWVRDVVVAGDDDRLIHTLDLAPDARRAHPTTEHFLPLLVAAGAAGDKQDTEITVLDGGITYGILSMDSYIYA